MNISVLVTGVTGSGKTTTYEALRELGYIAHDIESVEGLYNLMDEKTGAIVKGNRDQIEPGLDWNVNKSKLRKYIDAQPNDLVFYCGGMSNTDEIWDIFDKVIILIVDDTTTADRLSTRRANEFGYIPNDREWVLSWKHDLQNRWLKKGGIAVSAAPSPTVVATQVVNAVLSH
jgi:uridine kinase